jgi:high-affinity nickel-transport protein
MVALFVGTWVIALAVWHFARIEERWSARLEPGLEAGSAQRLSP